VNEDALTLPTLATEINTAHHECEAHARAALESARRCGELLLLARAQVPHGEWLPWLEANCTVSERTAQVYMRIAREWGRLAGGNPQRVADLSLREAVSLLAEPRPREAVVHMPVAEVPIAAILIGERRREDLGDINDLAESIQRFGLITPIGITDDNQLVVGLRRLRACQTLGWSTIAARRMGTLTGADIWQIELEENEFREGYPPPASSLRALAEIEATIEPQIDSAMVTLHALQVIRDQQLYREAGSATFDAYLHERLHLSNRQVEQIDAVMELAAALNVEPRELMEPAT
jgi:hypothetical protein